MMNMTVEYFASVGSKGRNRVKTMRIWFSNGNSYEYVINDAFGVYTDIEFVEEQVCDMVVLTILDVYRGYKYNDTCISEVEFF